MIESFIKVPNLPCGDVSLAIVDGRIKNDMESILLSKGIRLIKTEPLCDMDKSISYHPDIMLTHIGGRNIVVCPEISHKIILSLKDEGFNIIYGDKVAKSPYPSDVAYNIARIGMKALCNAKHSDAVVLEQLAKEEVNIINTKQGYSKCSICVVDENAVITSDEGIYRILIKYNVDCLKISPKSIDLFDIEYGFIGGASGFISEKSMTFYGNIENHPDYLKIKDFLYKHGKKYINLSINKIMDLGTLIPLKEYSIL